MAPKKQIGVLPKMKKIHSAPVQLPKKTPKPIPQRQQAPVPVEKKTLRVAKPQPQLRFSNVRLKVRNIDNQKVTNDEIRVSKIPINTL